MRSFALLLLLLAAATVTGWGQTKSEETKKTMKVKRITPVLYVKEIEPCLPFWIDRLGYTKTAEVPDGTRLGFVILEKEGVEVMYQSFASAEKDAPEIAKEVSGGRTFLYIEVDSIQAIIDAMKGVKTVVPLRTAPYGARELGVKDPAGHVVLFAEFPRSKI